MLQGLIVCGRCGERMTVRYHSRATRVVPEYVCQREGIARGHPICQSVPGAALDDAIGLLLMDAMTPLALDLALAVQDEIVAQWTPTWCARSTACSMTTRATRSLRS